ncbi:MAG: PQQ-binding-like beta-propeller repeat protein [Thermomicrobiales bacterium]
MEYRFNRRVAVALPVAATLAGLVKSTPATAQEATPFAGTQSDWPFYGQNFLGDKANGDSVISASNVSSLVSLWQVEVKGPISATPVIADGVAYVGSYDGSLYAIDLRTGAVRWTYATGADVLEPNLKIPLGITGSAAVIGDTVYVGDAAATVQAIDIATGVARWTAEVDDQSQASIWSSPVVSQGKLYVGVASIAKEVGFRGSVVALDSATGKMLWQAYMVPEGADGAGVFAVPAIDEQRGRLYVGTQSAYSAHPSPFGNPISVVALDIATGELKWAFTPPANESKTAPTDDVAFSASPNLFSVEIDGKQRDLVGEGQKSGVYWALDRDTGDVLWKTTVSTAGFLGGMEGTSAVASSVIAVPATDWQDPSGPAAGMVTGLDAATGKTLWSEKQTAPAASPAAISNDVVFHAGFDGILHAYGLGDGTEVWHEDLGASVSGGIAVAEGVVVLGAATPEFAPFIKPGNSIHAFGIVANSATPVAGTPTVATSMVEMPSAATPSTGTPSIVPPPETPASTPLPSTPPASEPSSGTTPVATPRAG